MSRPDKLTLTLTLTNGWGRVQGAMAVEVPQETAFMGERMADDFRFGASIGAVNFDEAVKVLKVKELRKGLLQKTAENLGHRLAEHLEDKEGWHGLDRQERLLEMEKLKGIPFQ